MTTQISDWTDLDNVRNDLSEDYELVNDLDQNTAGYSGTGDDFDPIGSLSNEFSGTFDGQGHAITDLQISKSQFFVGLFINVSGTVTDVGITNVSIGNNQTNAFRTGGLAAEFSGATILRCWLSGDVVADAGLVGGLAADVDDASLVARCGTAADVLGGDDLGGFVGSVSGVVEDAYANGTTGASNVSSEGGFAANNSGTIRSSWSATDVSTRAGFVDASAGDELSCYWDTQASGQSFSDGDATGLTTSEMQGAAAADTMAGLTFFPTWSRVDGSDNAGGDGYPILRDLAVGPQASLQSVSISDYYQLPQSLTLTATNDPNVDEATVELSWSDPADGEDGYRVYRSAAPSPSFPGDFTQLVETIPDVESYADDGAAFDTDYAYRVAAFDATSGEATPRASATVSVGSPGPFNIVITGTNAPVGVGEELEIDVEIENTGSLGGETEATVDLTEQ